MSDDAKKECEAMVGTLIVAGDMVDDINPALYP